MGQRLGREAVGGLRCERGLWFGRSDGRWVVKEEEVFFFFLMVLFGGDGFGDGGGAGMQVQGTI